MRSSAQESDVSRAVFVEYITSAVMGVYCRKQRPAAGRLSNSHSDDIQRHTVTVREVEPWLRVDTLTSQGLVPDVCCS